MKKSSMKRWVLRHGGGVSSKKRTAEVKYPCRRESPWLYYYNNM